MAAKEDLPGLIRKKSHFLFGPRQTGKNSTSGFEVDFILGDHTGIAMKAKEIVSPRDVSSLRALAEERKPKRHVCVSLETRPEARRPNRSPARAGVPQCAVERGVRVTREIVAHSARIAGSLPILAIASSKARAFCWAANSCRATVTRRFRFWRSSGGARALTCSTS